MKKVITLPDKFNFHATVTDHGWYLLPPFYRNEDGDRLSRVEKLTTGKIVLLHIKQEQDTLVVEIGDKETLTSKESKEVIRKVKWMFRLDEDFSAFYKMCSADQGMQEIVTENRGRLLRSPSIFEDIVKTILTTNTTWSRTIAMTTNFVTLLGDRYSEDLGLFTFPGPEAVLKKEKSFLNQDAKLGYRSEYIYELAFQLCNHAYELDELTNPEMATEHVVYKLKEIRGVGPYALSTILMLLGRYDFLPVDSEFKKHVKHKYFAGELPPKSQLQQLYKEWGEFKFLAYWFDR
ncbi:DNA-3-methyladenine glycosylase family protein [Oceanobacillus locisalsi]|uniref:DNA-(apurinic or apyrimidinic site) lyase n=1 Tax=Oceanobacillus locisalsi TaxID=546107 RepID=A0ABW3NMJ4_9BACI